MLKSGWLYFVTFVVVTLVFSPLIAQDRLKPSAKSATAGGRDVGNDWPTIGGPPGGGQYSTLSQITKNNLKNLRVAWTYRADSDQTSPAWSFEAIPLHVNGLLYLCSTHTATIALDPESGRERWRFDPRTKTRAPTCRGVSYWQGQSPSEGVCEKRIFRGVSTAAGPRIYALDANTGKPCTDFGASMHHAGFIDLAEIAADPSWDVTYISSPGAIYKDLLIVGEAVLSSGSSKPPAGVVYAFDVRTGALKWSFCPVPAELRHATGKASVWPMMSVDTARGLVFLPTTSPSPNFYGGLRTAEMPYADAVVALKADTGEVVWAFQDVHHDIWDYDLPAQPILATIMRDGQPHDVVIQTTKTGFTFVLDRDTGKSLFPVKEKAVAASDVPGEIAAPTQPMADLPEPYARQTMTRDDMFGLTPIDRAACRKLFDESRYEGIFTPPSLRWTILYPSMYGGGNWGGAAYDPVGNRLIVKATNLAFLVRLVDKKSTADDHRKPSMLDQQMNGLPYRMEGDLMVSPLGIPCSPPPWGTLSAIDMSSGHIVWQVPLGQVTHFGIAAPALLKWGSPNIGGPLLTKAGLIFIAGALDSKLRALDTETGAELWHASRPEPGMSVPITYMAAGKQYVVIAAGGNINARTSRGDTLVAFALAGS